MDFETSIWVGIDFENVTPSRDLVDDAGEKQE